VSVQDASLATILHAIWTQGPLSMEQIMEITPELTRLERVNALLTLNRHQVIDQDDSGVDPLYTELPEREPEARALYVIWSGLRACRVCGCTDDWACDGECEWVGVDLCSECVGKAEL